MKSKEEFKNFVKVHPELISYVKSGEMSWQKFYELYDLYDDNNEIWNKYFTVRNSDFSNNNLGHMKVSDVFNAIKNVKPEALQQNITSIQKFLGFIQDFVGTNKSTTVSSPKGSYTPRPTGKIFED